MNLSEEATAKACCADLYQSDIARLILGDTLHPGGLGLTNRLGRLMGLQASDWVVDLACGRGVSAMALSRVFHCRVLGVEFGGQALLEAHSAVMEAQIGPQAFFVQADAEEPPLKPSSVDAVICECSLSIFAQKSRAVQQVKNALRPGGKFGLSDVTVEPGSLPDALNGVVGQILCLSSALNADGYVHLLQDAGMILTHQEDASAELVKLLDDLSGKLGAFSAWQNLSQQDSPFDQGWLPGAPDLIEQVKQMVQAGHLGYWLFVAKKPA